MFPVVLVKVVLLRLDHVSGTTDLLVCETRKSVHTVLKTTENIHVSDRLLDILTFLIIVPYKYSYLLTLYIVSLKYWTPAINKTRLQRFATFTNYCW